ncbi:uracil phosphoribosyltransferase [Halovenus salina]|uniref:Uracil phosphoribosyltransferase n=1 Tax=Halovenus salina TaxID=1510225 RepID=A0ABD5W094_9EURY|nr:uracil phosphoribosyltransferase [Halovenus salina]
MTLEERDHASVVTHALAQHVLTDLRSVETSQVEFRKGLVKLGRLCGYELIDSRFPTETGTVETPLAETPATRVSGLEDVVIVNVLRAATPFVEGLLKAFPTARQGVISASRDEDAGMGEDGEFPISVQYVKLPDIDEDDTVIIADPMLATGSTMVTVLDEILADGTPESCFVLSAVSAPPGLERITEAFPEVEHVTVSIDEKLDDDGFIVPGLGDAGDRAFRTT